MQKIIVELDKIPERITKKAGQKFMHLSIEQMHEVSTELGIAVVCEFLKSKTKKGEEFLFKILMNQKLVFTWVKGLNDGSNILFDRNTLIDAIGGDIKNKESIEDLNSFNENSIMDESEEFIHPLTEGKEFDESTYFNIWGITSGLINGVRGLSGDKNKCEENLKRLLIQANPTANINYSIARIKLNDKREMMQVCNTISNIENLDKALEKLEWRTSDE